AVTHAAGLVTVGDVVGLAVRGDAAVDVAVGTAEHVAVGRAVLVGADAAGDDVLVEPRAIAVVGVDVADGVGAEDVPEERPLLIRVGGVLSPADAAGLADDADRDVHARRVDVGEHAGRHPVLAGLAGGDARGLP